VLRDDVALRSITVSYAEVHAAVLFCRRNQLSVHQKRYFPFDLAAQKPAGGRAKVPPHELQPELFGQSMEEQRRVCAHARPPSGADTGHRRPNSLPERSRLTHKLSEGQAWTSCDHPDGGAGLVQKSGQIERRGPRTNDGHITPFEVIEPMMLGAMCREFRWEAIQNGRNMLEVTDSDGADDVSRLHIFAIGQSEPIPGSRSPDCLSQNVCNATGSP
jgi:hypothetical protein